MGYFSTMWTILLEVFLIPFIFCAQEGKPFFTQPMNSYLLVFPPGSTVNIVCNARGNPTPTVTWYKNGKVWTKRNEKTYPITPHTFTLSIKSAIPADSGVYKCNVSNKYGYINKTYQLEVKESHVSIPVMERINNVTAYVGDNVTVLCKAVSDGVHTHFQLLVYNKVTRNLIVLKPKLPMKAYLLPSGQKGLGVRLFFPNVSLEDAKRYTCMAGNDLGHDSKSFYLNVLPKRQTTYTDYGPMPITASMKGKGDKTDMVVVIVLIITVTILFSLVVCLLYMVLRQRKQKSNRDYRDSVHSLSRSNSDCREPERCLLSRSNRGYRESERCLLSRSNRGYRESARSLSLSNRCFRLSLTIFDTSDKQDMIIHHKRNNSNYIPVLSDCGAVPDNFVSSVCPTLTSLPSFTEESEDKQLHEILSSEDSLGTNEESIIETSRSKGSRQHDTLTVEYENSSEKLDWTTSDGQSEGAESSASSNVEFRPDSLITNTSNNNGRKLNDDSSVVVCERSKSSPPIAVPSQENFVSRYECDFEHESGLGEGASGVVFQARNKIDDCQYAVKRIRLPNNHEARDKVMREVKVLATLDHSGIVRYYHSWCEEPPVEWQRDWDQKLKRDGFCPTLTSLPSFTEESEDKQLDEILSGDDSLATNEENIIQPSRSKGSRQRHDTLPVENENSSEKWTTPGVQSEGAHSSSSCNVEFRPNTSNNNGRKRSNKEDEDSSSSLSRSKNDSRRSSSAKDNSPLHLLYIQMQLCRRDSLKDWLNSNIENRDYSQSINIFKQLVVAVEYIHQKGHIHRDLKPPNILFGPDGVVKVSDFGLAAACQASLKEESDHDDSSESSSQTLTSQLGTELYMSPEQVSRAKYNFKVDIFSLGVIFFELFHVFKTQNERHKVLTAVRKGEIPENFQKEMPLQTKFALWLLAEDPRDRPCASEILSSPLFSELINQLSPSTTNS